jgi:hypothetical protein
MSVVCIWAGGSCIIVEFEQYNIDEGGAYFYGFCSSIEASIRAIEEYCNKPILSWQPLDPARNYPSLGHVHNNQTGTLLLAHDIGISSVPLPIGIKFELRGSPYWRQFAAGYATLLW